MKWTTRVFSLLDKDTNIIRAIFYAGFVFIFAYAALYKVFERTQMMLIPFSIGAFTAHMAHNEYYHYYNALFCCIASVVLFLTDKRLTIVYRKGAQ